MCMKKELWGSLNHMSQHEEPSSAEEIKAAIWDLPKKKALGSNGFLILFLRRLWRIVRRM